MTIEEIKKLKNGDLIWVAISRHEAHAVYFCKLEDNGVLVEDWSQGFPIHFIAPLECVIAPYGKMNIFEEEL